MVGGRASTKAARASLGLGGGPLVCLSFASQVLDESYPLGMSPGLSNLLAVALVGS